MNNEIKRCVTVMLLQFNEDRTQEWKYLVLKHMKCKMKYTFPAGTCETGESEPDTIIREMKEELNLDLRMGELKHVGTRMAYYDRIDGHKPYLESTYMIPLYYKQEVTNMEPDKHPTFKWVTLKEIFENPEEYTYNTWLVAAEMMRSEGLLNISY